MFAKKLVLFLIFLNLIFLIYIKFNQSKKLIVDFFNVGEGDSVYIRTPDYQDILIDGGPSFAVLSKLGEVMPFWDRSIDIVILTHPHSDHITGLVDVLNRYKVNQVYLTGVFNNTYEYIEFLKILNKRPDIKKIKVDHNFKVKLSPDSFLYFLYPNFDVLNPYTNEEKRMVNEGINNTSIVVKFVFKDKSFLFTGDIQKSVEKYLFSEFECDSVEYNKCDMLKSQVLKIAHQGSKSSSSPFFLDIVKPKIAVISVGENKYGHPSQEVLERLNTLGIKILRTDLENDIIFKY